MSEIYIDSFAFTTKLCYDNRLFSDDKKHFKMIVALKIIKKRFIHSGKLTVMLVFLEHSLEFSEPAKRVK